jgi:enediyne biosynthesis protein E4
LRRSHARLAFFAGLILSALTLRSPGVKHFRALAAPTKLPVEIEFKDIAVEAGLTAPTIFGEEWTKNYILEQTGAGVAIFDYDNDGLMDIFVVNGTTLSGTDHATNHLYRNTGNLRFEDVTARAGLTRTGWGQGVCAADYDNDGHTDLFVSYYGHSVLYRNQGDGTFRDVTERAGLRSASVRWDTGCSFLDYDLDGKLDLVVAGYVDFDPAKTAVPGTDPNCEWKGVPVTCGPRGLPPGREYLFHNEGDGRFQDVSEVSGIGKQNNCYGFTVVTSDFDDDGYPDAYVACDSTASLLFHNRKDGTFEEIGVPAGVAFNENGRAQAGMGVAAGDYDDDGLIDIVKTNFSEDVPSVYKNRGDGSFTDQVFAAGLAAHTLYVGWGVHLLDVDHDGRKDILIVNGHVYPNLEARNIAKYRQPRLFYWNRGGGRFADLSDNSGPGISARWCSRGSAAGDLDNDGSLEVVVSNMSARPSLLKNYGPRKSWLLVRCIGVRCNRDAVGARVYISAGGRKTSGEVQTGASFLSQNDPRLHFGLGEASTYDRIEVRWPGGQRESFPGGKANRIVLLRQGTGRATD